MGHDKRNPLLAQVKCFFEFILSLLRVRVI